MVDCFVGAPQPAQGSAVLCHQHVRGFSLQSESGEDNHGAIDKATDENEG